MPDAATTDRQNLSRAPSWVMVGFGAGVLTMWALRSDPEESAPPEPSPPPPLTAHEIMAEKPSVTAREDQASLAVAEALFEQFRHYAFWNEDKTQIGVWNSRTLGFTDRFEIWRTMEGDYFRSISDFTRLPLEGYGPENSPLLFTETAEQRAMRYRAADPDLIPRKRRPPPIDLPSLPPPPED